MRKAVSYFIWLFIMYCVMLFSVNYLFHNDLIVDESPHYEQIKLFHDQKWLLYPSTTLIPGYHYIISLMTRLYNTMDIGYIRIITTLFSGFCVVAFILLISKIDKDLNLKFVQSFFFPILFPFFFLIYTDVMSLTFVLLMVYFALRKNYLVSGIFSLLSFLVRQNNVIWVAMVMMMVYYQEFGVEVDLKNLYDFLKKSFYYLLTFLVCIHFLMVNHGFSIGDRENHPMGLFVGNIYFFLFLFFVLFLPMNIENWSRIRDWCKKHLLAVFLITFFLYTAYILLYRNVHAYNIVQPDYYIRNAILMFFDNGWFLRLVYFLPCLYSVFSIIVTELEQKQFYLIYPFAFLFLLPLSLIEQRYSLVPLLLFISFRKMNSYKTEVITTVMYIAMSAVLLYGIKNMIFFL